MIEQNNRTVNNKRLAKNTIYLYLRMIIVMLLTFYSTRVLLTVLGVEDFGIYNVVCGFVTMFNFLNTSMANGTQRFYNYEIGKNGEKNIGSVFTHAIIIQIVIAVIILILAESVGLWYLYKIMIIPTNRLDAAFWIYQFSLLSLLFVVFSVPFSAAVMAYEKMDFFAITTIIDAILKLLIVLCLPYIQYDQLILYGILMSFINILNFIFYYSYCRFNFSTIRFNKSINKNLLISMLSFSGWNVFGSLAHISKIQGVNLVFNAFWGTVVNTSYGIATQISNAVSSLTVGFVTALRPQMIKSYASGDINYTMKLLYSASKLTFFLVLIIAIPVIGEIKYVLDMWLGEGKYPFMTPIFCQLTILTILFDSFATPLSIIVHASGKMRNFQVLCSFVILLVIPFAYLGAKFGFSTNVILIVCLLVTILTQIVRLILIKQIMDFSITSYCKYVFLPTIFVFVLSSIGTLFVNYLPITGFSVTVVKMVICFIFVLLLIYTIGLNNSEKQIVKSFFSRLKK